MSQKLKEKNKKRELRKRRTKARLKFSNERPRICIFRSSKHIYAQALDENGKVLASASSLEIKDKMPKINKAFEVGKMLGQRLINKKIIKIAFDRSGYKFHGRVKALADGLRQAGLQF